MKVAGRGKNRVAEGIRRTTRAPSVSVVFSHSEV